MDDPRTTLIGTLWRAESFQDDHDCRFLPTLSKKIRDILLAQWRGQLSNDERKKLARYGVFNEDGSDWSCEYVRRKYFRELFHNPRTDLSLFNDNNGSLPSELDLLKAGLSRIKWRQLKQSAASSYTGFPIEDIWQAEFYGSIGDLIPRDLVFCKEYVTKTDSRVDFVLRNGSTRAIEFLIRSSDVEGHHRRFESGSYINLRLGGSYLVVDIKPWGQSLDIHEVTDTDRLQVAAKCFEAISIERRSKHAVFLVSNDVSSGILYTWDTAKSITLESLRSPPAY